MKKIHKVGIAVAAPLIASYVVFSSIIFLAQDSGSSNERWVGPVSGQPQAEEPKQAEGQKQEQASGSSPDLAVVYSVITANLEAGEFDRMIAAASAALEKHPRDATLHYFRGFANLQQTLLDDAVRDFSAALEIAPARADAYRFRAQTYIAKGQPDLAIADADRVCELEPQKAESYVIRVMAYLTKGDLERAKRDVAKVLELDPNNAKAKVLSQQLSAKSGRDLVVPAHPAR
jgi:tetratricopeptide (TPR) repeat protein